MINEGLFSSNNDSWETPKGLFDKLNAEFNFELDVCATADNAKCKKYFTKELDGLKQEWEGVCWMNPPYGNPEYPCKMNCKKKICEKRGFHNRQYVPGIIDWMEKAYLSYLRGATVVCLVPARTDTEWWHNFAMKGEIRLIKGRLHFGDGIGTAPFPSAIVIFGPKANKGRLIAY